MGILDAPAPRALNPDDSGYDLVLLLGQSNMAGYGLTADTVHFDPPDPRIRQFGALGPYAAVISQAIEPLAMRETPPGTSPGMEFARWYAHAVPSNRRVLLVPAALGGTALLADDAPWKVGNTLYTQAIAQAQAALAAAGSNARYVAALWVQGEADSSAGIAGADYAAALDAIIGGLRTTLGVSSLPFVIGQMVPDYLLYGGTKGQVNAAHIATPTRITRTAFALGPWGLTNGDGAHYNSRGTRALGRSMFEAYRRVATATADPAVPTFPGQVTGLSVQAAATTQLNASWTATTGAVWYAVERKKNSDSAWPVATYTQATSLSIVGLDSNTSYDVRVTALNGRGPGSSSSITTISTPSGAAVYASDTFTRANAATAPGSTEVGSLPWQVYGAGSPSAGISSNQLQVTAGSASSDCVIDDGHADGTVSAVLRSGTAFCGLLFRAGDTDQSSGYLLWHTGAGSQYILSRRTAPGAFTELARTSNSPAAVGDVLTVVLSGTSIVCKVNGTQVLSVTDSGSATGTRHGFWTFSAGASGLWDGFSHTDATS